LRLLRLLPSYSRDYAGLRLGGTTAARTLALTIDALVKADALPGPGDWTTLLQPRDPNAIATLANVRRARGCNLWIWYVASDAVLTLHALTNVPPV